jgi:energy-coupling factor transporter ATP-binding protein EcfA2
VKVVYLGRASRRINPSPTIVGDVIELFSNNWDDYGYKTTFPTVCRVNGQLIELGLIRVLIEDVGNTSVYLDKLLAKGWSGEFPIPDTNYISTPSEIAFYEQLVGALTAEGAIHIATILRDGGYLSRIIEDEGAKTLIQSTGFKDSLQRERGSVKAFVDGWKILDRQSIAVLDLGFRFTDVLRNKSTISLKFQSESPLPHDVNVLIGPNGSGKSQLLHQMVRDWIAPSKDDDAGFTIKPNLSQLVVVSYSPFERFPVDIQGERLQDKGVYRYFGFRGRGAPSQSSKLGRIRLAHEFPKRNAAESLIACLSDDQRYRMIIDWAHKLRTVERVLRSAFDFNFAAVQVSSDRQEETYYSDTTFLDGPMTFDIEENGETKRFLPITSDRISELDTKIIKKSLRPATGVIFCRDNRAVELSSGQRLFAYVVINILGAIRRNSLILIDEPELFLHPTLEIQFIDMLKKILTQFNSKALLATHSVVTVREVPSECIHVFERGENEIVINNPPFQTFGGDFQRISSYVFGDKSVSKPFERWITDQISELGSGEDLLEKLGNDVNEELIVQIKAMQRDQW